MLGKVKASVVSCIAFLLLCGCGINETITFPTTFAHEENYVYDGYAHDGNDYNQVQGIASDGERYLFWALRKNDKNNQLVRKWDTLKNKSVGLNIDPPINYGHCEDMAFIPASMPGLDNGTTDRLYILDFDRSGMEGRCIHVVDANTLEYITSFNTTDIGPEGEKDNWLGASHVMCSLEKEKIIIESAKKIDEKSGRRIIIIEIYDKYGHLEKAVKAIRKGGTEFGMDCDENYIYLGCYVSDGSGLEGRFDIFEYALDWELEPVGRIKVDRVAWEIEGMCHIGDDYYFSWIEDEADKGVLITKATINGLNHFKSKEIPVNWPSDRGYVADSFEVINVG